MNLALLTQWTGSMLGLLGAFVLATNTKISRYGWIAFLLANFAMIAFALEDKAWGLLTQQLGFCLTSLLGIYRSFFTSANTDSIRLGG